MKRHITPKPLPEPQIIIKEVEVIKYITQPAQIIIKEVEVIKHITQPAQIITKEIVPTNITEEIAMLKQKLEEKDKVIDAMTSEKKALVSEITSLKEDKADLKSDKSKLYDEIDFLRKSMITSNEKLAQKASELEQFNKLSELEQWTKTFKMEKYNNKDSQLNQWDELLETEKKEIISDFFKINSNVNDLKNNEPIGQLLDGTGKSIYPPNEIEYSIGINESLNSSLLDAEVLGKGLDDSEYKI
jgi:predicted nuclease with TOPRIM domain